jgi:hypothetical protein
MASSRGAAPICRRTRTAAGGAGAGRPLDALEIRASSLQWEQRLDAVHRRSSPPLAGLRRVQLEFDDRLRPLDRNDGVDKLEALCEAPGILGDCVLRERAELTRRRGRARFLLLGVRLFGRPRSEARASRSKSAAAWGPLFVCSVPSRDEKPPRHGTYTRWILIRKLFFSSDTRTCSTMSLRPDSMVHRSTRTSQRAPLHCAIDVCHVSSESSQRVSP